MINWAGDFLDIFDTSIEKNNSKGMKICTVKTVEPLVFTYNEVDISSSLGDVVYVHPLFTYSLIDLDESALSETQSFTSSTAYSSPSFTAVVEGSIPQFIEDFYLFYKNWCSIFRLSEGDLIAVYEYSDGSYIVLQKVVLDK